VIGDWVLSIAKNILSLAASLLSLGKKISDG
jgi:hypothetical protein